MVCPETQSDNRNTTYDTVIQWLYHQIFEPMNISTVAAATTQQAQGAENLETAKRETASALKRALSIKRRRHSNSVALKRL